MQRMDTDIMDTMNTDTITDIMVVLRFTLPKEAQNMVAR
jgi:hypothetical protein